MLSRTIRVDLMHASQRHGCHITFAIIMEITDVLQRYGVHNVIRCATAMAFAALFVVPPPSDFFSV
jgi:hypothetical protein